MVKITNKGMETVSSFWQHLISPTPAKTTKKVMEDYQVGVQPANPKFHTLSIQHQTRK
jgi:hypothetical protein